jgi:hypothetical protein
VYIPAKNKNEIIILYCPFLLIMQQYKTVSFIGWGETVTIWHELIVPTPDVDDR